MNPEIEALKKLASQQITKGKLQALQKAHSDAYGLSQKLQCKSTNEDDVDEFSPLESDLDDALSDLESAIDELDSAEDKDEREDAISSIEDALDQTITAFDAIMPVAIVGTTPRPSAPTAPPPTPDPEMIQKAKEILASPGQNLFDGLEAWTQSAGSPELVKERKKKIAKFFEYLASVKPPPTPPAS
jgi:hypothetical protein